MLQLLVLDLLISELLMLQLLVLPLLCLVHPVFLYLLCAVDSTQSSQAGASGSSGRYESSQPNINEVRRC